MSIPREVVDRQLAAYNARDIDAFVACYAVDAVIARPHSTLLASGHAEIRDRYGELFGLSPDLRAEIVTRMEVGSIVIDEEQITGFVLPGMPVEIHAAVAYRVEHGLIQDAHLFG